MFFIKNVHQLIFMIMIQVASAVGHSQKKKSSMSKEKLSSDPWKVLTFAKKTQQQG